MTFLNPLVLIGLAAAAIPVILHLLNLRKLRKIEFSTLTFLKELQQTKIRRLKLRQIILLIIRTLLVIFIVLAFARPTLRGTFMGSLGGKAKSSIVLIIDDSFSMSASDEYGERFRQAKEACMKVISLLKEGDEVFLIKLSDVPQATMESATHDFNNVRRIINEAQISLVRRSMGDAIRIAARLLQHSDNVNKEVYIFSDVQQTLFSKHPTQHNNEALDLFNNRAGLFLIQIGGKDVANAAIDSLSVTTSILEQNKPVNLYVSFRDFSNSPLHNLIASVYLDGIRTAQRNISIEPWGSAATEFTLTPKRTGFIRGYVEIENDAIEFDNKRYFTINVPANINIAMASKSEDDIRYLSLALKAGYFDDDQSLFTIKYLPAQKFSSLDLKNIQTLICSNISSLTQYDADRIVNFVEQGGGLIIFPGDNTNLENLNQELLSALGISRFTELPGPQAPNANLTFGKIDFDHPIFNTIFEQTNHPKSRAIPNINSPTIFKIASQQSDKHAQTIIFTSDRKPFLSEYSFGNGKILLFSVAPILSWSDFPLKGIFAPIIYRSAMYVGSRAEKQQTYITGDQPIIKARTLSNQFTNLNTGRDRQFKIISPVGIEEIIQPVLQSTVNPMLVFTPPKLESQGIYEIRSGAAILTLFSVDIDPYESDTRTIAAEDIGKFFNRFGINEQMIHSIGAGDKLQSTILQTRFGIELWRFFIGMALLMALLEMLFARDSRKTSGESS